MGYLKTDVNFKLLGIIILIAGIIVAIVIIYQSSLGRINTDYSTIEEQLKLTSDNLTLTTNQLMFCNEKAVNLSKDINDTQIFLEKAQSEYNKIYEQTEGELSQTEKELKAHKNELQSTKDQLSTVTNQFNNATLQISFKEADNNKLLKEIVDLEKKKDELKKLKDKLDDCKSNDNTLACYNALS